MNKVVHSDFLIQYEFLEVLDRISYKTSVFVFLYNNKALLIDSGYLRFAKEIKADLIKNNITVEIIIITHYHRDHAEGSLIFNNAFIIASSNYKDTMNKCQNLLVEDLIYKIPDLEIQEEYTFNFYNFHIKIFKTPGHSPDGISVLINKKYLYVSDNILEDINGKMIIPYIDKNSCIKDHINSLEKYKKINFETMLLTHGKPKFNKSIEFFNNEIDLRNFYLKNINSTFDMTDYLKNNNKNYVLTEMHKINKRSYKRRVNTAHQNIFDR